MGKRNQIAMIEVDLRKIDRLQKAMHELPEVVEEELQQAVIDLALVIEEHAKRSCPVDTGKLRNSITPVVEDWARTFVGTNTEYAPYVEYGTRKMEAQPFLEPAFIEGKKRASKVFGKAISRAISRFDRQAA